MLISIVALTLTLTAQTTSPTSPAPPAQAVTPAAEELWDAARAGDLARVNAALAKGANIDAKTRYGVTALMFAADKGHTEVVRLLLEKGADTNIQDTFY